MSIRQLGQTLLGIVLAATPVALWIAWTPSILGWVAVTAALSAGLLVLLTEPQPEAGRQALLPDEFFAEVQRLHPMVYHHSGRRSSRFHRTMRRLSQLLRENERGASPR